MFNSGFRPAVNAGTFRITSRRSSADQGDEEDRSADPCRAGTVPRAGGILPQFGSDLDADTKERLAQGERIKEILKQPQYQPMPVQYQVIIIYAATKKYLLDVPVKAILRFEKELFEFLDTKYPEIPSAIISEKQISDDTDAKLQQALKEFKASFK